MENKYSKAIWNSLKRSLGMWAMWLILVVVNLGTIVYETRPYSDVKLYAMNMLMWLAIWALYFIPVSIIREIKET